MKRILAVAAVALVLTAPLKAGEITGQYIEARTCDVWTGRVPPRNEARNLQERTMARGIPRFLASVTTNRSRSDISGGVRFKDVRGSVARTSEPAL